MILAASLTEAMPRATDLLVFKVLAPMALFWNPVSVRDWLFDQPSQQLALDRVGFEPWVGAIVIAVIAIVTAVIAHRRYRKDF
jgi:hypothetical protein